MYKIIIVSILLISSLFSKELEKVSLQLQWLDQFQFAGYYMAKEKGFYRDAGLEVELKKYNSQVSVVEDVLKGKTTYGIGRSSLIVDKSEGAEIKLLAAIFQDSPSVFISTKESNIKSIKDFAGKRMMSHHGSYDHASFKMMIEQEGVDIDSMTFIKHTYNIDDLIYKKTDIYSAYISNAPFRLKEKGIEINIFNPSKHKFNFYDDILFTSDTEINNYKQRTINFRDASLKGWEYAFSHIDETVQLILKKYNPQNKSREHLLYEANELKKLAYAQTKEIGKIEKSKIQRIYDIYNISKHIKNSIDVEDLIFSTKTRKVHLTKKEKNWVKTHPIVTYSEINWKPLSIIENGKMSGIMGDYLDLVSARTGIIFKYIPSNSWPDVLKQHKEKKIDLVPGIGLSAEELGFGLVSKVYKEYPMVIVTGEKFKFIDNLDDLSKNTIAVPKYYTSYKYIIKNYPNIKLITTQNIEEALLLVESGKADAFVGHIAPTLYYMSMLHLPNLKIAGRTKNEFKHAFLLQEKQQELLSIINKAFDSITEQEKAKIDSHWIKIMEEQKVDYTLLWQLSALFISILGLFIFRQYILDKKNKELQLTQEELTKYKDRLELAFAGSTDGLWDWDIVNDSVYFSPRLKNMLGYEDDEIKNDFFEWKNRIHPDDLEEALSAIDKYLKGETEVYNPTHRLKHKDGSYIWILDRGKVKYDEEGNAIRFVGTYTDISELKDLQHSLQEMNLTSEEEVTKQVEEITASQKHFETIFENAIDGIAIVDLESNFLLVNSAYEKMLEMTKEELYKTSIIKLHPLGKQKLGEQVRAEAIVNGTYKRHETQYITGSRKLIDVMSDISLMPDKKTGLLITKDITQQKADKKEIEFKEQQLFAQSRLAQMGEMISMIAHQWRQPLGSISTTAANLKLKIDLETFDLETQGSRDECGDYFTQRLNKINGYVKNLTTTIDDFRNFYKPDKSAESVKLDEVLEKALGIIEASLKNDNIEIIKTNEVTQEIEIYDNELMQVFLNIFKNAQDNFREKEIEKPKLIIEVHDTNISITDNGGGIPEHIIDKIFDPYFSTKDEKNGTGLGLYMSKTIVEDHHNGKLEVFNVDDGVCFRVDLDSNKEVK